MRQCKRRKALSEERCMHLLFLVCPHALCSLGRHERSLVRRRATRGSGSSSTSVWNDATHAVENALTLFKKSSRCFIGSDHLLAFDKPVQGGGGWAGC
jgi:hypothetical protein